PKLAANDRAKATPEEALAVVGGSIAYYGTYSVNEADKSLAVSLQGSTFANLLGGPPQKRIVTALSADELKFTNPRTPAGVTLL
ncbi:lipocalin-like domain-containing protein, partial [Klebsiella pneumoniae]|nr:lipocalin-like domain-containing protein [Klebsiella pneumoniae]